MCIYVCAVHVRNTKLEDNRKPGVVYYRASELAAVLTEYSDVTCDC